MAINVELTSESGKIFEIKVGDDHLEKSDFKHYLKLVKGLKDREFDSFRKVWKAPLNTENILTLDMWISKEQMKEIDEQIK